MDIGGGSRPEANMEALLRRARAGDREAFADISGSYSRRVFGLCRHLLGSTEAAEDATSEVFLRAQRAMGTYDSSLPFPRWLLSIAGHYCLDQLRRRGVERRVFQTGEVEEPEATAGLSPLGELLAGEQRAAVREALAALPERYRAPLVLRYYGDLSYQQIAAALDLTRAHVATLLFRAKQELRRTLEWTRKEGAP